MAPFDTIRPIAGQAEIEEAARVLASSDPWLTLGFGFDRAVRLLENPASEVYVALASNRLVGLVVIQMQVAILRGYIQILCVWPGVRSQGIGAGLMDFAEARIFEESPNVFLCHTDFNHGARRFYDLRGYVEVGELTNFLVEGGSEFLMRKTRGPWSSI